MNKIIITVCIACFAISLIWLSGYLINRSSTALSPLPLSNTPINRLSDYPINRIIYGFLPYWNLKLLTSIPFAKLTDLAYFALPVDLNGNFIETDIGYRRWQSNQALITALARTHNLKLDLVITAPDDPTLFSLLNNPVAQDNLANQLALLASSSSLSGINIDFEPTVATDSATINGFTQFITQLHNQFQELNRSTGQPIIRLSIDIYPSAAASPKLWDLSALSPYTDYFIVMAYDYYRPGSEKAGPVAPIYPASPEDRHSILKNLAQVSLQVPRQKIILGIPFYGYEWPTLSNQWLSPVTGRGTLASYHRIQTLLKSGIPLTKNWSSTTLSPWISYQKNGQTYQIYYDNPLSLTYKKELVIKSGIAGLAIWALGYDAGDPSLWRAIK
jgi:spore germination protein YaaH